MTWSSAGKLGRDGSVNRGAGFALALTGAAALSFAAPALGYPHPPDGFADRALPVEFDQAVGLCFDFSGRMYVWEKGGKVWTVDHIRDGALGGVRHATPLIDLSEEVGNWGDHGLLGFALDPSFAVNGYIYLLYVVDYHHLLYFGTPEYHADWNWYNHDTIGRLVRYTARAEDDFQSVDPASRTVLIGNTIHDGFPVCNLSHSAGSIVFGEDGTMLVSFGDGASFATLDVGGPIPGWTSTCREDGIIREDEDIGALRAQSLSSLNGKILRLNPATGAGVASNPYYDPTDPFATRSRVWEWGVRNSYRFTLRPGTGSTDPNAAHPGTLYIGDVGWDYWEELNIARTGGLNFGWPLFEGMYVQPAYMVAAQGVPNVHAPNPLHDSIPACGEFFSYADLMTQETLNTPSWPNPCNPLVQVPPRLERSMHTRPAIDWYHFGTGPSRTSTFDSGGLATSIDLDAPGSPVPGPSFIGTTSIGGAWASGKSWPGEWRNVYFHGDFTGEWIKAFDFDDQDRPTRVRDFTDELGNMVDIEWDPVREALWYIRFTRTGVCEVRAILPDDDLDPFAAGSASPSFGPGPLSVSFSSAGSSDPEGGALAYHWDFGDGSSSDDPNPTHVYQSSNDPARYDAMLTVTDPLGQAFTTIVPVWVDNSPPAITITSPEPGLTMPPQGELIVTLNAVVTDAEQPGPDGVESRWLVILHHDTHTHLITIVQGSEGEVSISPHPCDAGGSTYYYEFVLEATDALGLVATQSRTLVALDCNNNGVPDNCDIAAGMPDLNGNGIPDECEERPECPADFDHNGVVNSTDVSDFINAWFTDIMNGTMVTDFDGNGVVNSTDVSDFINAFFAADPLCLT